MVPNMVVIHGRDPDGVPRIIEVDANGNLGANKHIYKPKTSPGRIASKPGFPMVGTQMLIRRGPWPVSGIEPRKFDEQIAAAVGPGFIEKTNKAVELAMKGKK